MAGTFSQIYLQFVFAVKGRQSLIKREWEDELYKYLNGIFTRKGHKVIAINGMPDHVHLLIGLKPCDIPGLIRDVKRSSNNYINDQQFCSKKFAWQEGYGVFSYHQTMLDKIGGYVNRQKEHHARVTFEKEYKDFLDAFQIEYEDRFLFDLPE